MNRNSIFVKAVDYVGRSKITVVETGVSIHESNGRSTFFWNKDPSIKQVISIDLSSGMIQKVKNELPTPNKVEFIQGHSLSALSYLENNSVDLLYLDSDLDPLLMLHEALVALPKLRLPAVILIDDAPVKGTLIKQVLTGKSTDHKYGNYGGWNLALDVEEHDYGYLWMLKIKSIHGWVSKGYIE